jgi:hypothetical protein
LYLCHRYEASSASANARTAPGAVRFLTGARRAARHSLTPTRTNLMTFELELDSMAKGKHRLALAEKKPLRKE